MIIAYDDIERAAITRAKHYLHAFTVMHNINFDNASFVVKLTFKCIPGMALKGSSVVGSLVKEIKITTREDINNINHVLLSQDLWNACLASVECYLMKDNRFLFLKIFYTSYAGKHHDDIGMKYSKAVESLYTQGEAMLINSAKDWAAKLFATHGHIVPWHINLIFSYDDGNGNTNTVVDKWTGNEMRDVIEIGICRSSKYQFPTAELNKIECFTPVSDKKMEVSIDTIDTSTPN